MNNTKTFRILHSPLRLHFASSIQIPQSTNRLNSMLLELLVLSPKINAATKIDMHGIADPTRFRDHLKVRISPLKSPVLRNPVRKYRINVFFEVQCQEV